MNLHDVLKSLTLLVRPHGVWYSSSPWQPWTRTWNVLFPHLACKGSTWRRVFHEVVTACFLNSHDVHCSLTLLPKPHGVTIPSPCFLKLHGVLFPHLACKPHRVHYSLTLLVNCMVCCSLTLLVNHIVCTVPSPCLWTAWCAVPSPCL